MNAVAATRQRVENLLAAVTGISRGHFPQPGAKLALDEIASVCQEHIRRLRELETGIAPIAALGYCATVLRDLFWYLPIVGFLHRSKSPSNPFEIYEPLLHMAQSAIGPDTRLILSSEWEFSPYTLLQMPRLPSLVLVGLPASEASNALVTPLAGHEFGHSIWAIQELKNEFIEPLVDETIGRIQAQWEEYRKYFPHIAEDAVTDLFGQQTWVPSLRWSLRQCEEVFCDLTGLWLFGEAFLYAFAYLLSPGPQTERVRYYPTAVQRASTLEAAARRWDVSVPKDYGALFLPQATEPPSTEAFLSGVADAVSRAQTERLLLAVEKYMSARTVPRPSPQDIAKATNHFKRLVPADGVPSFPSLVAAGWRVALEERPWPTLPLEPRRLAIVNDLVLKSAEVLEVTTRLQSIVT